MNEAQVTAKLESMKKTRKLLAKLTLVASLLSIAMLLAYNFLPVTYIKSVTGSDFEKGFSFPGWQMIFLGIGRQYIPSDHLFDPNPFTIVGMLGTLIVVIVLTKRYNRGKNKEKAIKDFVMGGCLLYSSLVLGALIIPVSSAAATVGGLYDFKNQYLLNPTCSYTALPFATVTFLVLLCCALVKIGNGVFLLYQKSFALKNAPKKTN